MFNYALQEVQLLNTALRNCTLNYSSTVAFWSLFYFNAMHGCKLRCKLAWERQITLQRSNFELEVRIHQKPKLVKKSKYLTVVGYSESYSPKTKCNITAIWIMQKKLHDLLVISFREVTMWWFRVGLFVALFVCLSVGLLENVWSHFQKKLKDRSIRNYRLHLQWSGLWYLKYFLKHIRNCPSTNKKIFFYFRIICYVSKLYLGGS